MGINGSAVVIRHPGRVPRHSENTYNSDTLTLITCDKSSQVHRILDNTIDAEKHTNATIFADLRVFYNGIFMLIKLLK